MLAIGNVEKLAITIITISLDFASSHAAQSSSQHTE